MTDRYHMPAEWAPQQAIWLAWPPDADDWPDKFDAIPWVFCEMIRHIARSQRVCVLVKNQPKQEKAQQMLESVGANINNIQHYQIATNRSWLRDSGPTFVRDEQGNEALLDWTFNAWAQYDNWQLDNQVPSLISQHTNRPTAQPIYKSKPIVLEGGAIDVNGAGLLLTTKECLLDKRTQVRNPGFSPQDYQQVFEQYLGVEEIIWLEHGIVGDDTHGHVDDISRFVDTYKVVTAIETDKVDDNYKILQTNKRILEQYKTKDGRALEVIELPMPKALYFDGIRLPASYANFLICNDVVLVPTFNDANDRVALNILSECFNNREIIGIHAVNLVLGLGTLHCLSQQQPA